MERESWTTAALWCDPKRELCGPRNRFDTQETRAQVSETVSAGLEPGMVIGSRYRVEERLAVDSEPVGYSALDTDSQLPVVMLEVTAPVAKLLAKGKDLAHRHLANVLAAVDFEGRQFVVSEQVRGETLSERLAEIGSKAAVDAVRTALRIADALSSLHEAGGAHGTVHPSNVVMSPEGRDGPVLVFGPVTRGDSAFRQPEWEPGDAPSEPDDSWGAAALLFMMLVGEPPARAGYESETAVTAAGVHDPVLRVALYHALARDLGARSHDLRPLKRELARWFVEHAGEEPIAPGPHSTSPPPLPPSLRPSGRALPSEAPRRSVPAPPPKKKPSKLLMLASIGAAIGLIGGWTFSTVRAKTNVKVIEVQKPQAAATPPEPKKAIDLSEVPVNGESETASVDKIGSCVSGYLPKGTFDKAPDMSWVCDESDPRTGAEKLRVAVINGGRGNISDAMKIFARIGWYDMAAFAVVRAGCCENAKPLSLPPPSTGCTAMADSLREIGSSVVASRSYEESMKAYTAAIHCEMNAGKAAALRHTARPAGGEDSAFAELVHAVQP
jgi:serine/threonine protein kinase